MRKRIEDSAEKRRVVKEWDESGLSAEDFGNQQGVNPGTLRAWGRAIRGPLRKRSRTRPVAREVDLVEVPKDDASEVRVELDFGNGRRLVVAGALTSEMIVELAAAFEAVATG